MALHRTRIAVFALGLALAPAVALADDRPVTPQERVQIENSLRQAGFARWGEIEFDDGRFEVDDAIAADGKKYDLKLSGTDFSIQSRDLDD